VNRAASKPT